MLTIEQIRSEAFHFRQLIEKCDKNSNALIIDCFPVMSCKLSSMLLSYHFLTLWPNLEITGVTGGTERDNRISHYWLEIGDVIIDITGDQYNIINSRELNKAIVKRRPFPSVHVENTGSSYLYELFRILEKEKFVSGFPTIGEDFIWDMELGYDQLLGQVELTQ